MEPVTTGVRSECAVIPFFDHPRITIPLPFDLPFLGSDEITIYGFGIMVALGFLIGAKVAIQRADRVGLDGEKLNKMVGWWVLTTFVGGHWGYALMYDPAAYFAEPIKFLYFWEGLSSFGGIVLSLIAGVAYFKYNKLPLWPYLDNVAFGMAIGWGLGRTGCTLAHDHPGAVTNFVLGRQGICLNGDPHLACHDLGMYEALWAYGLFIVFLLLDGKPRKPGFYAGFMGVAYGPTRFLLDFLRPESTDPRYFALTAGQWWAMVAFLVGSAVLYRALRSDDEPVWRPRGAAATAPADPDATTGTPDA